MSTPPQSVPYSLSSAADRTGNPDEPIVDQRLFVGGVAKAFLVLSAFQGQPRPLSLSDVAEATGIGRSAAQRFLYTLKTLGYLRQDPTTRRYSLSPKVLELGFAYLRNDHLVEKAFPYLLEGSKRTDETINLTELDGNDIIYVSRIPSRNVISVDIAVGQRLPAYCTAPGRAMLAWLPHEQARDILERSDRRQRTEFTVTDIDEILVRLDEIRRVGYAFSNQETFVGDISVAAPVRDHQGTVLAAVNIAVPYPRWSPERVKAELVPPAIETARAISKTLGGR